MKISISDPAALRRVITLAKQVDAHDASIAAADKAAAELKSRRASLARRLAEHRDSQPDASIVADDALVDAIAADPSSRPGGGAYDAALDRQREAREATDEWQANLSVLEAAVGKLDREIAAACSKAEELESERYAGWAAFVRGAHAALADEFVARFTELRDSVMTPMAALCKVTNKSGLGSIATYESYQFTSKTLVELHRSGRAGQNGPDTNRLFPPLIGGLALTPDYGAQAEAFREALVRQPARRA